MLQTYVSTLITIFTSIFVCLAPFFYNGLKEGKSKQRIIDFASQDTGAETYKSAVKGVLNKLDAVWSSNSWSTRMYDFNLLCAVVYPFGFMIVSWFSLNSPGKIGDIVVIAPADLLQRILAGVLLLACVAALIKYRFYEKNRQETEGYTLLGAVIMIAVGGPIAAVSAFAFAIAGAVAFAVIIAFTVAVAGAGAGVVAVAVAVAFTFFFAFGVGFGVTATTDVTAATGVAFAGVGAGASLTLFLFEKIAYRNRVLAYFSLTIFSLLVIFGLLFWLRSNTPLDSSMIQKSVSVIVFLGLFPLVNAILDFVSYGLTRFCLKRSANNAGFSSLAWSGLDFILALVLLIILSIALCAVIQIVNLLLGSTMIDLKMMFMDMKRSSQDYWWLYATLLSTLLPTLLHFTIAAFSFITLIPKQCWHKVAELADNSDDDFFNRWFAAFGCSLGITFSLVAPIALFIAAYRGVEYSLNQSNLVSFLNLLEKLVL
jgi:hypothetical protein